MSGEVVDQGGDAPSSQIAAAPAAGWFGKLPMLGDFASRRLPPAFIAACDQWLSQGLRISQAQLGTRWLDVYLTAPVWRFAWAPGVIDTQWWFGVTMPSVDAVGRYFPLIIAAERPSAPTTDAALEQLAAWFAHVGAAALDTLHEGATLDALENALAAAPAWPQACDREVPSLVAMEGRQRSAAPGEQSARAWAATLAVHAAMHRYSGHSLWWPLHDLGGNDSLSVREGLPSPDEFVLMLEGSW